ncbi:hypothetical protein BVIET440_30022 [Burkholderia vietnamiensis]
MACCPAYAWIACTRRRASSTHVHAGATRNRRDAGRTAARQLPGLPLLPQLPQRRTEPALHQRRLPAASRATPQTTTRFRPHPRVGCPDAAHRNESGTGSKTSPAERTPIDEPALRIFDYDDDNVPRAAACAPNDKALMQHTTA